MESRRQNGPLKQMGPAWHWASSRGKINAHNCKTEEKLIIILSQDYLHCRCNLINSCFVCSLLFLLPSFFFFNCECEIFQKQKERPEVRNIMCHVLLFILALFLTSFPSHFLNIFLLIPTLHIVLTRCRCYFKTKITSATSNFLFISIDYTANSQIHLSDSSGKSSWLAMFIYIFICFRPVWPAAGGGGTGRSHGDGSDLHRPEERWKTSGTVLLCDNQVCVELD